MMTVADAPVADTNSAVGLTWRIRKRWWG